MQFSLSHCLPEGLFTALSLIWVGCMPAHGSELSRQKNTMAARCWTGPCVWKQKHFKSSVETEVEGWNDLCPVLKHVTCQKHCVFWNAALLLGLLYCTAGCPLCCSLARHMLKPVSLTGTDLLPPGLWGSLPPSTPGPLQKAPASALRERSCTPVSCAGRCTPVCFTLCWQGFKGNLWVLVPCNKLIREGSGRAIMVI